MRFSVHYQRSQGVECTNLLWPDLGRERHSPAKIRSLRIREIVGLGSFSGLVSVEPGKEGLLLNIKGSLWFGSNVAFGTEGMPPVVKSCLGNTARFYHFTPPQIILNENLRYVPGALRSDA